MRFVARCAAAITLVAAAACGASSSKPSSLIAFDDAGKLYVVNPDGSGLRRLMRSKAWQSFPDWSPDGRRIAFVESPGEYDGPWVIHVMNSDGSGDQTVIRSSAPLYSPDWAPDGRAIAFDDGESIQVVSLTGGRARRIVSGRAPAWSPDGTRLAYGDVAAGTDNVDLFVVRADGGGPKQRLTRIPYADIGAAWSPDGKKLVFQHGNEDIYRVNADGTGQVVLLRAADGCDLDWSPDGKTIVFTGANGIDTFEGGNVRQLVPNANSCGVSWQRRRG
jgi:Tol biopolymer transport system component